MPAALIVANLAGDEYLILLTPPRLAANRPSIKDAVVCKKAVAQAIPAIFERVEALL